MARLELERGIDVLLLETGDALLLELLRVDYERSLSTTIGLYSWVRWTTMMKRRVASIGTNRELEDF